MVTREGGERSVVTREGARDYQRKDRMDAISPFDMDCIISSISQFCKRCLGSLLSPFMGPPTTRCTVCDAS